jgi:hypothetical protein
VTQCETTKFCERHDFERFLLLTYISQLMGGWRAHYPSRLEANGYAFG